MPSFWRLLLGFLGFRPVDAPVFDAQRPFLIDSSAHFPDFANASNTLSTSVPFSLPLTPCEQAHTETTSREIINSLYVTGLSWRTSDSNPQETYWENLFPLEGPVVTGDPKEIFSSMAAKYTADSAVELVVPEDFEPPAEIIVTKPGATTEPRRTYYAFAYAHALAATQSKNWAIPTDVAPSGTGYNPQAVVNCWKWDACTLVYSKLNECYMSTIEASGGLKDPNNKEQSLNFQDCFCDVVTADQDGYMTFCTECLRKAGVSDTSVNLAQDKMNDFCNSADPNVYMWLADFLNFTYQAAPQPGDKYTKSFTLPVSGVVTQFTTQTTGALFFDPLANRPNKTTHQPVPPSVGAKTTSSSNQTILTFPTWVPMVTTTTIATKEGGGANVLVVSTMAEMTRIITTMTIGFDVPLSDTRLGTFTVSVAGKKNDGPARAGGEWVMLLWVVACVHVGFLIVHW